jgi:hypothetical protein
MKRLTFAMLILMLAGSAMAANVTITLTPLADNNGWASVNYTADANVRAFALVIEATGATIADVNHYFEGECDATNKGYGIFLDQTNGIDINDAGGVDDWGSPVADACSPGAAGTGIGTNKVIIGMGALYEDGNEPPLSGKLCDIKISSTYHVNCASVDVTAESTYRGGVVLEDGNSVDPNVTAATDVCVWNCSDGNYTYFALRSRCDNTDSSGVGSPDGYIAGDDLSTILYFFGWKTGPDAGNSCDDVPTYEALCIRCDNTDSSGVGPPDGYIGGDDLSTILYFFGNYSCN